MSQRKAREKAPKPKLTFSEGEEIMARWPGSQLWFEAVVISTNDKGNVFLLRFADGQENEFPLSHLSVWFKFSKQHCNQIK